MSAPRPLVQGVRKIAVLRPNAVGDFVFAVPALHALRHAYPEAELVYLGKAWHADFLAGRPGPVDRVVVMPPVPGVGTPPDGPADEGAVERFTARMRDEGFDILAQMYGGGSHSNPFARRLGARLTIGARADGAAPLDRWVPHVEPANRRLALLEIAALVGGTLPWLPCELELTPADRTAAAQLLPPDSGRPLVLLQPGSSDPRRCWAPERFATVGDALAAEGMLVAVNGTDGEAALVRQVAACMRHPCVELTGRLGLGGLCGLIERAALVVSNDTGPLHLALAIGTRAVGIFWHTNLVDGAPLRPGLLRAAVSAQVRCRTCGLDNRAVRCQHQPSFVDEICVDEVLRHARTHLRT
ncbi:glycosyltransferase family 9 protein [Massilia sp. IC2-476]|uniref:glycosyltransferase family 9 protein n=1 Tax=Massilia sp. IC2-476 TaxID=2887199 RepID=UPI001D11B038|nr:glycosyltransferase family 9 protein [Massilia sp. IC2-476]MCC2972702.1 glycosyltransferase family 9 protein [Massilia sp. IC2-476]